MNLTELLARTAAQSIRHKGRHFVRVTGGVVTAGWDLSDDVADAFKSAVPDAIEVPDNASSYMGRTYNPDTGEFTLAFVPTVQTIQP